MPTAELTIVIVSWNVKDLLKKCLASIFENRGNLDLAVIVADNASADQTAAMVKNDFPQVKLIANDKNLGFAQANNQGIKESQSEYILALNPDTEIAGPALKTALDFMKQNEKIGIVGAKHLNPDKTLQPSVRRFPNLPVLFLIFSKIAKILPNLKAINNYLAKDFDYQKSQPCDQVAGSFLFLRKEMLDQIGLFDERFFTWFEEVDLCRRAKSAGWQVWYLAEAEIIHHGGQSFSQQLTLRNQKIFFQSAYKYLKKHGLR